MATLNVHMLEYAKSWDEVCAKLKTSTIYRKIFRSELTNMLLIGDSCDKDIFHYEGSIQK